MKNFHRPAKMWIDGKCFDIRKRRNLFKKAVEVASAVSVDCTDGELPSSSSDHGFEVNQSNEGKFSTNFHLPNYYYRKLAGFDLKALGENTRTTISLPPKEHKDNIVITGEDENSIIEVRHELHSIIHEIRNQMKALQFISIPTTNEKVIRNFIDFKEKVLQEQNIDGMEESIFQSPLKLHLTVAVFTLMNEKEQLEATRILNHYKETVINPFVEKNGPLHIELSGIDCMDNNLKKVNVLYAKAKIINETKECNLQKFANDLSNHFYEGGLVRKPEDNVKLHMTLMNTKYRKVSRNSPKKRRWTKRISFDATKIIEKYKDFHFGEVQLNSIHLSHISTTGADGFYKPLSIITF